MFSVSSTYKNSLRKNIKTLTIGEERAYFYVQESKAKTARRCFFIAKIKVKHSSFGTIDQLNPLLKKLKIAPFGKTSLLSIGIARKDENGVITLQPKKQVQISGTKVLRALKDLSDFKKQLRGIYLYQGSEENDESGNEETNQEELISKDLPQKTLNAINNNTKNLEKILSKKASKNKRNILHGAHNLLKKGRQFLGGIKDNIGNTLQAIGSLRPSIKNNHLSIRADADELFDLTKFSDIIEFDREKSENLIHIEIVQFPAKEIIVRSQDGKPLAFKNINLDGTVLNSVEATDVEIHLKQDKDTLQVTLNAGTLQGEELSSNGLELKSFTLKGSTITLARNKDIAKLSASIDSVDFAGLKAPDFQLKVGLMTDLNIECAQSKAENHFNIHAATVQNEQLKTEESTLEQIEANELSIDGVISERGDAHLQVDLDNTTISHTQYQDKDLGLETGPSQTSHVHLEIHKQSENETSSTDIHGEFENLRSEDIHIERDNLTIDIEHSSIENMQASSSPKGISLEATDLHSENVHMNSEEEERVRRLERSKQIDTRRKEKEAQRLRQLGNLIDDAQLQASVPLTDGFQKSILWGQDDTTIQIDASVQDGKLVPGELDIHLDKDIRSPFLVSLRGAYIDKKGRFKVDLRNFFDIGIAHQLAKQLGVPPDRLLDIPELTASIIQKLPREKPPLIDIEELKAKAQVHLKEGPLDINDDVHLELDGGEEDNLLDINSQFGKSLKVLMQQFLFSEINLKNTNTQLENVAMDRANLETIEGERSTVDVSNLKAKKILFESSPEEPYS